nr:MAG: hypothetical protein [uncultured archaeon]BDI55251.1 MAG: hypothetical protein [uncultured archaeon]
MSEEEEQIDCSLVELLRRKYIEHVETKEEDDSFRISKEGKNYTEKILISDPEMTLFYLSLSRDNPKQFYEMIKQIAGLLEE